MYSLFKLKLKIKTSEIIFESKCKSFESCNNTYFLFISVHPPIASYSGDHHICLPHHLYELSSLDVPRTVLLQAPTVEQDQYPYKPSVRLLHVYPGVCYRN